MICICDCGLLIEFRFILSLELMLGVADLHTPEVVAAAESGIPICQPVIPLAGDSSETDSEVMLVKAVGG